MAFFKRDHGFSKEEKSSAERALSARWRGADDNLISEEMRGGQ